MTIHRDLDTLEQEGSIVRVRGGAKYIGGSSDHEPAYELRATKNKKAKETIAQKAVKLLSEGRAVFFDAGSTMMELALIVPDIPASIITNGPNIAMELAKRPNVTVNLCGGTLNRTNMILTGSAATEMVSRINIDIAFIVASGYSEEGGFTCGKEAEAFVKSEVIRKARTVAVLLDNSKIGAMLPFTFATMEDIDYLVTEAEVPEQTAEEAAKYGVTLL
ncbi:MAG: DeoR/GlpR transcriptional regulator [Oscillospiraceae bacterium]|nr:DeoR/GlpR transcriptional regulator [Oscillospiraceae bacterium]MBQ9939338.1 DeoR/GlpR transcriptional regulator [Oscillospiraceae bacterium]